MGVLLNIGRSFLYLLQLKYESLQESRSLIGQAGTDQQSRGGRMFFRRWDM